MAYHGPAPVVRRTPQKERLLPRVCPHCGKDIAPIASNFARRYFRKEKET
jgi:hypothetical protein